MYAFVVKLLPCNFKAIGDNRKSASPYLPSSLRNKTLRIDNQAVVANTRNKCMVEQCACDDKVGCSWWTPCKQVVV